MGNYDSIQEIMHSGGITLYILILCSILLVATIIERVIFFLKNGLNYNKFLEEISLPLSKKDYQAALRVCKDNQSVLTETAAAALVRTDRPKEEIEEAMETALTEGMLLFEKRIPIMGTLAVTAPFIGLMGTVLGIMQAFADIAVQGSAGPASVARGVSEALIATAAGLFVAIPASICFNYFKSRCSTIKMRMLILASKILESVTRLESGAGISPDMISHKKTNESGDEK